MKNTDSNWSNRVILSVLILFLFYNAQSQNLHAIVISSTNDATIGIGSEINHKKIINEIKNIGKNSNLKTIIYPLTGSKVTEANITATINKVQPNKNDVIIFWYSGHGLNDPNSNYPVFLINHRRTKHRLDKIHKNLQDKGGRFVLTIGDCCNFGGSTPQNTQCDTKYGYIEESSEGNLKKNYQKLFRTYQGGVIARSSQKGEYSHYSSDIGGLFTYSLVDAIQHNTHLEDFTGHEVSWEKIADYADCMTVKMARLLSKQQNPVVETNISIYKKESVPVVLSDTYIVQKDDNLGKIATKYNIPEAEKEEWINAICTKYDITPETLRRGMELNLNKKFLYVTVVLPSTNTEPLEETKEHPQRIEISPNQTINQDDYFIKYVVKDNETLWSISEKFNIKGNDYDNFLLWLDKKYKINEGNLQANTEITLPNISKIIFYKIENGDNLSKISRHFKVPQERYANWIKKTIKINKIPRPYNLQTNEILFIEK